MADVSGKLLNWSATLSVGVEEIDKQHKTLIDRLNHLEREFKMGKARDYLGQLIRELGDYVLNHFKTEERYMEQTKYPGLKEHAEIHREFMKKIIGFDEKYKNGNVVLTGEMMIFLRDWVRNHIADMDQKLGQHLRLQAEDSPGSQVGADNAVEAASETTDMEPEKDS